MKGQSVDPGRIKSGTGSEVRNLTRCPDTEPEKLWERHQSGVHVIESSNSGHIAGRVLKVILTIVPRDRSL
jgi:hypothetical protein